MGKPHTYPTIPSLHEETQFYTQRRRNSEAATNYRFTIADLMAFTMDYLSNQGFIKVIDGEYASDTDAQNIGGGAVGDYYRVAPGHELGIPSDGGILKRIQS